MTVNVDRADVQDAGHVLGLARPEDVARRLQDRLFVQRPRPPVADAGGAVVHGRRAVERRAQALGVAEIARRGLDAEQAQESRVAFGADQRAPFTNTVPGLIWFECATRCTPSTGSGRL